MFTVLCAGGVNQGVAAVVFSLPEGAVVASIDGPPVATTKDGVVADTEPRKKPTRRAGTSKASYASGILARNVFDSSAIGKEPEGGDESTGVSDLKVKLLATMVAIPASFSTAFIVRDGVEHSGSGYGIGDKILGAEVLTISKYEVKIRRPDGVEEVIKMSTENKKGAKPNTSKNVTDDDGISKDGDNKYTVKQELVDKYLGDLEGISRLGRAIPHRGADGAIDGYRLSGIRRGTVGEKLGIRNGDIVHKVNGYDLTSISEAMKAFQELQKEDSFNFELTRRGKKQTMEYDVQ